MRQPLGCWLQVIGWIFALGMVKRESANQPRLKLASQIHGPLHILLQIAVEWDIGIGRAVFDIEQLDLANRRADRGHGNSEFAVQLTQPGDFGRR